ncbi:hypothetical protein NRIC_22480 [Enterococcus florum]|uniref:Uncharacterized protein n=1 Tax=Enterococcus florum TaxID=2480627 RepID=A0A4P5P8L6_9ENTE|nr:hypothetical protein NRIC_22480 [Enterococcus florum]
MPSNFVILFRDNCDHFFLFLLWLLPVYNDSEDRTIVKEVVDMKQCMNLLIVGNGTKTVAMKISERR